jgi:hypothetical protein
MSVHVLFVCFSRIYLGRQNIFLVFPISLFSMNPQPHFLPWIHMKIFGNPLHDFLGNFKSRHVKIQNSFGLVSPLFTYAGWAQVVTVSHGKKIGVNCIHRALPVYMSWIVAMRTPRRFPGKNSVQTVSTVPPSMHAMDSRLEDFLACPHAASVTFCACCFSASTMRGWIMLTGHMPTIHGMYIGRQGGYRLHWIFFPHTGSRVRCTNKGAGSWNSAMQAHVRRAE